jgi:Sulfotransferase domain
VKRWISLLNADPVADETKIKSTLHSLLDGYVGVTDCPAAFFSGELASIYPDAVVICTTRDPERWFQSFQVLAKTVLLWWLDIVFLPMPTLRYFGTWIKAAKHRYI